MPYDRLRVARRKTVGTRQTAKALEKGIAKVVYVAADADAHLVKRVVSMCQELSVEVVYVDSMAGLGKACGIDIGAASAAIVED